MLQKTLKFRPQGIVVDQRSWATQQKYGKFMASPLAYRQHGYNWQERRSHIADHLARIFGQIHYLTAHSPVKVQVQWKAADHLWKQRMRWWKAGINERL